MPDWPGCRWGLIDEGVDAPRTPARAISMRSVAMDRARRRQELSERVGVGLAIGALPWRKPTSGILGLADSSCFIEVSHRE
jgi:hypothetical protein